MTTVLTEHIRLIFDTEEIVRRAVQLRRVKSRSGETMSVIIDGILREALAEEIDELKKHDRGENKPKKRKESE
jgi:hypothetical protein